MATWPVAGDSQTYPVGPVIDGVNYGTPDAHLERGELVAIDIPAPRGTPIVAVHAGTITASGYMGDAGYAIDCEWDEDGHHYHTRDCHMPMASGEAVWQEVAEGEQIGSVGSSGKSTVPHDHHWMMRDGKRIDPREYHGMG